jgi:hypothetical protein
VLGYARLDGVDLAQHRRVLALILDLHQVGHEFLLAFLERRQLTGSQALILVELFVTVLDRDVLGVAITEVLLDLLDFPRSLVQDALGRSNLVGQLLNAKQAQQLLLGHQTRPPSAPPPGYP